MNFDEILGDEAILSDGTTGRIIRADTTPELFAQVGADERLLTYREMVRHRVAAFTQLTEKFPKLQELSELEFPREVVELMAEVHIHMLENVPEFAIWMRRFTTSTNMIRGTDEVYFWDHQLSGDYVDSAVGKGLQDGGFDYGSFMDRVRTEAYAVLDAETYETSKGGAFGAKDWEKHPVFSTAISDPVRNQAYTQAVEILSHIGFYNTGQHSGWVPDKLPSNYGRIVSAGNGEALFYPVHNSTLHHLGIVVKKETS